MIEPLNDNTVKFFLDFRSDGAGKFEIDEPIGFDAANFVLRQEDDRYGRDISYAAGEAEIRFYKKVNQLGHQFDRLIHYRNTYGYESDVQWIVQIDGLDYVIGELDFRDTQTDQITYFQCRIIQVAADVPVRRRHDIEFDLLSGEDLDGNSLPFPGTQQLQNVFLRPNEYIKTSRWEATDELEVSGNIGGTRTWNYLSNIKDNDIESTLSFAPKVNNELEWTDFKFLEAVYDLKDVELKFENIKLQRNEIKLTQIIYAIGNSEDNIIAGDVIHSFPNTTGVTTFSKTFNIENIPSGRSLWVYFRTFNSSGNVDVVALGGSMSVTAKEKQIPVVLPTLTFGFAIRRLIQAISGQTITAEFSEEFQNRIRNQYVFNGLMLRGFSTADTKMIVTFDDVMKHLQEINADYQLRGDKVFFGVYEDFYTDEEIGAYEMIPSDEFYVTFNDRYVLNKYTFNYEKFEDDRDKENILFSFHTESSWFIPNKRVESNKDVELPFIRDSFLINTTREYNIDQANSNSTQNDDDIFILDCLTNQTIPEQEISFIGGVQYDEDADETLITNSQFDFRAIGLRENSIVRFEAVRVDGGPPIPNNNKTLTDTEKGLITLSGGDVSWETAEYVITLYYVPNASITNRTDEGFYAVENVNATVLSNLRFTIKRNILNYWGAFLKTCTIYSGVDIQNTYFKNNGQLITGMQGDPWSIPVGEDDSITQDLLPDPVVSANEYNFEIKVPFSAVDTIIKGMRDTRGYIRLIDNTGKVIKVYPKFLDYDWERNVLLGTGEEKYEDEYLDIVITGDIVTINDTGYSSAVVNRIRYTIEGEFLTLFDVNMYPLNTKKLFKFVKVNGQTFNTIEDLARELEKYDNDN